MKKIITKAILEMGADKKSRDMILTVIFSIAAAVLFLMAAPILFLSAMKEMGTPSVSVDYSNSEINDKMIKTESDGKAIEDALTAMGLRDQIVKAQLIYMTYFNERQLESFNVYANMFTHTDDHALIENINSYYEMNIDYDEFEKQYMLIMNTSINEYMFTDAAKKNSDDLAAWVVNAYSTGWEYKDNYFGNINDETHLRCADNIGLIMGYIRYEPCNRSFSDDITSLFYTAIDSIDSIPDVKGIGVHGDCGFGVYIGNGEVIYSSAIGGIVREPIDNGSWDEWCIFDAVSYPQEVYDKIEEIRNKGEDDNESGTEE